MFYADSRDRQHAMLLLLQTNPVTGDAEGNARRLFDLLAAWPGSEPAGLPAGRPLCLLPACALAGHNAEPLARAEGFFARCRAALEELAHMQAGLASTPRDADILIKLPTPEGPAWRLISRGVVTPVIPDADGVLRLPGIAIHAGLPASPPVAPLAADIALYDESLPYFANAQEQKEEICSFYARALGKPVLALNACGATDGDVLPGQSCAFGPDGSAVARAAAFEPALLPLVLSEGRIAAGSPLHPVLSGPEAWFRALRLAIADNVRKCGLGGVVIGLSGGMDSSMVVCLAAEALGPDNVLGVLMPSPWSSDHSVADALELARRLGVPTRTVPIAPMMAAFEGALSPHLPPAAPGDLTNENLQARIRGVILMAFANRMNRLVLAPSNKSEAAMGYCTLYGDTVGALEPIGDLYKTEVYALGRWYNAAHGERIPEHVFTKAPSAELRPGQTDQDSLPPYDVLDAVLREILENGRDPETLALPGVERGLILDVARRLHGAEFKRHQIPPVVRLSACVLGRDWFMPIAAKRG